MISEFRSFFDCNKLAPLLAMLLVPWGATAGEELAIPNIHAVKHASLSPRLTEWKIVTAALGSPTFVRVLLPEPLETGKHYPVLYLLHGGADDFKSWSVKGDVERITASLSLIVIMPDGGRAGWYTNWFNRGAGGVPQWETYHIDQLIDWVDDTFPTRATRDGRAIAGLSMGGFGALSYAARHPDLFRAAAAFSGFVDIATPKFAPRIQSLLPLLGTSADEVFGDYERHLSRWQAHNPVDLAENLRGMTIVLRTGNGLIGPDHPYIDPIERSVHPTMVSMHESLNQLGIEHTWEDYGPAGHRWSCWKRSLEKTLTEFMPLFDQPTLPSTSFSFVSAEPDVAIHGWRLTRSHDECGMMTFKNASNRGFEVKSTVDVVVTTPPAMFHPSEVILAKFQGSASGPQSKRLEADSKGCLVIPVTVSSTDEKSPDIIQVSLERVNGESRTTTHDSSLDMP